MSPKKRAEEPEEHVNHERWLVSYADMITVLMALFIVLYAMSQVDSQKFEALADGLAEGFGNNSRVPVNGGMGLLPSMGTVANERVPPDAPRLNAAPEPIDLMGKGAKRDNEGDDDLERSRAMMGEAEAEFDRLGMLEEAMKKALEEEGLQDLVRFRIDERGLVAAIVADDIVFDDASAQLKLRGREVIEAVAPVLSDIPDRVVAEGHANHLPMRGNGPYPSNWELSAARAASVVRLAIDAGPIAASRMQAVGYSNTKPLYAVNDPEAITGNRRVDLVLLSPQTVDVRKLLPQIADAHGHATTAKPENAQEPADAPPPAGDASHDDVNHAETTHDDGGHDDASDDGVKEPAATSDDASHGDEPGDDHSADDNHEAEGDNH